ncbi:MAG: SpaH/EbpB family LPXTG-anchored major pilin [Slackia sp.]|nr:SpaH/EbpB family LPXTG-anchored major pilin [Slackia sp.]
MQTTARKVAAVFVAAMLAFAMAFVATPTKAYAAGTGKLTVISDSAEFAGKEVKIWKMFDITVGGAGTDAETYGYAVDADWKQFFIDKNTDFKLGLGVDPTDEEVSTAAYNYISNLGGKNDQKVTEFAKLARNWAIGKSLADDGMANASDQAPYTAEFANLDFGYYVVSPAGGSTSVDRKTDAMLVPVKDDKATIELKSVYPTVDKKVETDKDNVSAEIGKKLTFTLKSTVPDVTEYNKYRFAFKDELSKGLTFGEFVSVTIGGQTVNEGDYDAPQPQLDPEGKTALSVKFGTVDGDNRDAKALFTDKAGQEIVVTYTAFINADAIVGQAIPNKATVDYSTNPDGTGNGTSVPSVTNQYDFGFKLKKTDGATPLAGAQFELRHEATGAAINLVQVQDGVYRLALEGDNDKVTTVTTGDTGIIEFRGLAAGDYYLVETQAPSGFNKLGKPVKITITDTTADGANPSWTVKVDDAGEAITGAAGNIPEVTVVNNKGTLLPETGGMGTIAFTVVGALVIIGGVVWAVRRKRNVR